MLPNSIRGVIVGPSCCGKTQLLLTLIMKYTNWDKLYLIAPSVDNQHCYLVLIFFNETASENVGYNDVEFITDVTESSHVDDLDISINHMIVYDDVMLDNQKKSSNVILPR